MTHLAGVGDYIGMIRSGVVGNLRILARLASLGDYQSKTRFAHVGGYPPKTHLQRSGDCSRPVRLDGMDG